MVENNHSKMRRKRRDETRLVFSELLGENQKIFRFRAARARGTVLSARMGTVPFFFF